MNLLNDLCGIVFTDDVLGVACVTGDDDGFQRVKAGKNVYLCSL